MTKIDVYYDYTDEGLSPKWMLVHFGVGMIDWEEKCVYLSLDNPFEQKSAEEFIYVEMGLTITLPDLIMSSEK